MSTPPRPPAPHADPGTRPVPPPGHDRHAPTATVLWAALAWSAVALALGLGWLSGALPVSVLEAPGFGSLFAGRAAALPAALALALGSVGAVCAVLMLRGGGGRAVRAGAWGVVGVALLGFVDGDLLALLGYTMIMPVVGWVEPGLAWTWVLTVTGPAGLTLLFFTAGAGLWALAALVHRRTAHGGCARCGRAAGWSAASERATRLRALRVGRIAVGVGAVTALLYPSLRLPWIFGVPVGMSEEDFAALSADPVMLVIGVSLGTAGVVGAVLMLGLVQGWGVRFPRWTAGLAGRRVPVPLAVVPAALVAAALVAMGRGAVTELLRSGGSSLALDAHAVVFASMAVWGLALGVAAAAYAVRRRAECARCGRGLPEVAPRELRPTRS